MVFHDNFYQEMALLENLSSVTIVVNGSGYVALDPNKNYFEAFNGDVCRQNGFLASHSYCYHIFCSIQTLLFLQQNCSAIGIQRQKVEISFKPPLVYSALDQGF